MRILTVLRHAKSDWGEAQLDDFDRPLNARGRAAAEAVGRELKGRGLSFDLVLASPALRVRQTLDFLAPGYGDLPSAEFDQAIYAAPAQTLAAIVAAVPESCQSLLLVGHNPGVQQLVLKLVAPGDPRREQVERRYPTAAAAVIRFAAEGWNEAERGDLAELIIPRELTSL